MPSQLDMIQKAANYAMWLGGRNNVGKIFHVNGDAALGDDRAGMGFKPEAPLLTMEAALDLCRNGKHDYILVSDCYNQETFPVTIDKTTVHIIAMGVGHLARLSMPWCTLSAGANAVFELTAASHYCEIAGFQMGADDTHPCILVSAGVVGPWIHHNAFATQIATRDGILVDGGDLANGLVEWNLFGKALTRDGMRGGSFSELVIQDNILSRYGGIGLNLGGEPYAVLRNKFYRGWAAIGAAAGWAITMVGANCIFDENHAMESATDPQNNPYKDTSTEVPGTTKNAWGENWAGTMAITPAVV
ncbi:hypothetical protein ES703_33352 [subsurface metagenome]